MRFPFAALCLLAVCPGFAGQTKNPARALVGTWRYDLDSIRLDLSAKAISKEKARLGKNYRPSTLRQEAEGGLKPILVSFRANRTLVISMVGRPVSQSGTWTLSGRTIKVVMTNLRQKTPSMTLAPNGKRIHVVDTEPGLGVIRVDLVKRD